MAKGRPKDKQKNLDALAIIVKYKMEHDGNSPSYAELEVLLGYHSKSAVDFRLKSMEKDGLIVTNGQRNIVVIGGYQNQVGG